MKFNFITGYKSNDTFNTYVILGTSFMQPPASDDAPKILKGWFAKHKNAVVIPVSSFGPPDNVPVKKSLFVFCWIIDNNDTLNNYLVRNGCFPGGTMYAYDEWEKMNANMRKDIPKPKITVYVSSKSYEAYKMQIVANEIYAHDHKLGVWSDKEYYKIKAVEEKKKK